MTILITGATGFIGRNLIDSLNKQEYFDWIKWVTVGRSGEVDYKIDLTNFTQVKNMVAEVKPSAIIHLASNANSKPDKDNPSQIIFDNVLTTQNLLEAIPDGCRPNFILASSILVYGEKSKSENEVCEPTSVYGMTKLASENLVRAFSHKCTSTFLLRMCATVGSKYMTHGILYDLIRKTLSQETTLEVFGEKPGSYKPFIHIDDVVKVIRRCLCESGTHEVFNICPDDSASAEEVALRVLYGLSSQKLISWNASAVWRGDSKRLCFSNDKYYNTYRIRFPQSGVAIQKAIENYECDTK